MTAIPRTGEVSETKYYVRSEIPVELWRRRSTLMPDDQRLDPHPKVIYNRDENKSHDGVNAVRDVAHSLGGLVCKMAILRSRNNPQVHLRGIFDSVKGIIFMGTPHRGAWMADWAKIPVSALALGNSANVKLLDV
jgi:hypothetical protein